MTLTLIRLWYEAKVFVEQVLAISNDVLHVIIGIVVWLIFAAATRRPISSSLPLLGLACVLAWNEIVDLSVERWPDSCQQYGEGAKDALLTMLIPIGLMLISRFRKVAKPSA